MCGVLSVRISTADHMTHFGFHFKNNNCPEYQNTDPNGDVSKDTATAL